LGPADAVPVFLQLLAALDYLYAEGQLHLNLKPENIMVMERGVGGVPRLKLLDFGLAPLFHPVSRKEGRAIGAPPYTAPEYAAEGLPDTRVDLYAVGVLLYMALSGRSPFKGKDADSIRKEQAKGDPRPLKKVAKGVSSELSEVVQRLMSRKIENRFSSPRQAMLALAQAAGKGPLLPKDLSPLPFSDPDQAFRYQDFAKMFRRILIQGGMWAFQGKRGTGKTFFARWMQRYFWLNKKAVWFYQGDDIARMEGDTVTDSSRLPFIVIDDADRGPVQAWLTSRPYPRVILLGEDLAWTKEDSRWQFVPLKESEDAGIREALTVGLGTLSDKSYPPLARRGQSSASALVQVVRDLHRQDLVAGNFSGWQLQEQKFLASPYAAQGVTVGTPLPWLPESSRRLFSLLALVQVPLSTGILSDWLATESGELHPLLLSLVREGLVERKLWLGREYFQSQYPTPSRLDDSVKPSHVKAWVRGLRELGWTEAAVEVLGRFFQEESLKKDAELVLLKSGLLSELGRHGEIFKEITSPFVKSLPAKLQGEAFEILGRSLLDGGKRPQAEAALKNAYNQYRSEQDVPGQARVLAYIGLLTMEAGDRGQALKFYGQSLAMAKKLPESDVLLGEIELKIGDLYAEATDYDGADAHYQASIQAFHRADRSVLLAESFARFARLELLRDELQSSEYYGGEALSLAIFHRAWRLQGEIYLLLAELEETQDRPAQTVERLNQAVFALSRTSHALLHARALARRAYFLEMQRRLDQAEQDCQKVLKFAKGKDVPELDGQARLVLGKIRRRNQEKLNEAVEQFTKAKESFERSRNLKGAWECEFERGEVERSRHNSQAARSHYEEALRILDRYLADLAPKVKERLMKEGKRDRIEMAIRWLDKK
jgi:tetratricopeptide (TPR) repeat protein